MQFKFLLTVWSNEICSKGCCEIGYMNAIKKLLNAQFFVITLPLSQLVKSADPVMGAKNCDYFFLFKKSATVASTST